jgi:hypothetical protein
MQAPDPHQFVEDRALPLLGGRRFSIYRADPPPAQAEAAEQFNSVFAQLDGRFREDASGPIGVCVPVSDAEAMRRLPEAVWPETELLYAGTQREAASLAKTDPISTQLRIRYFDEAAIGPALPNSPTLAETRAHESPLEDRYRIVPLSEAGSTAVDDVLALWAREQAVPAQEAQRRVHEVHLVAIEQSEGLVGISSAYLQRNAQLQLDLWYYRAYVAKAHRHSSLAVQLALRGRDLLEGRFLSGEDQRAPGMIYEVENPGLKQYFNKALWLPTDFTFIGENKLGAHVRVHYFPGARAPIPQ